MKNITIFDSGSVYDVLSRSNVTIGINSTVFFEALAYNDIYIYIYTIGDYEGMKPLLDNGMALAVNSPSEFIGELKSINNCNNNVKFEKELWKKGAIDNISRTLAEIIDVEK